MGILAEKKALILGLVSRHSIAYGIAAAMKREGAALSFTYQSENIASRVKHMAETEFDADFCEPCDLSSDTEIQSLSTRLNDYMKQHSWDNLDIVVHSVAYAPKEQLQGDYIDSTTREGFQIAHDISSYSFTALAKALKPLMLNKQSALLTLSYLGADRVVPNYNVMALAKASLEANVKYMASSLGPEHIRVNAISAGPIRTLASSGIKNLNHMLEFHKKHSPLRELTTTKQVGDTAAFLCSDMASGITGVTLYVDGGFHTVMPMSE